MSCRPVLSSSRKASVLLVHRPKYDDWSFPKGKVDLGERAVAAAVREAEEETGLKVRIGPPLGDQRYRVREGMKTVRYWSGRVIGDADVSGYLPNAEIDDVAWVDIEKAPDLLTYAHDVDTLHEALERPYKTRTLIVLRHAVARSKKSWSRKDSRRPLLAAGRAAGRAPGADVGRLRRTPAGQLEQHSVRADPRAVRTGDRPEDHGVRGADRGERLEVGSPSAAADDRAGAGRRTGPGGRTRGVHPPAGPPVGVRRPGHRRSRAGEGRADRPAPTQGTTSWPRSGTGRVEPGPRARGPFT